MALRLTRILKYFFVLLAGCSIASCNNYAKGTGDEFLPDYWVDTSEIPNDTIAFNAPNLTYKNGVYFLSGKAYSGIVHKKQIGYNIDTYSSVHNGKLHGTYESYYPSGKIFESRMYKNNLSVGKQYGYWEDTGKLKFEYNYYNNKKEGEQKSWYANGDLSYSYHYKDDKQEGLQQAWRLNGSLYRNFVVKNGTRYGLQKTTTCYELEEEEIK
ncbi:hypothetical protein [uncultured Cyclobacterium sp.]|uniref:toxin-antitoxin system YwqK family antitoxin n=1 Tax=uncultured Cyclobacterium sp. TaxID=453820 RepID=UPI0030ED2A55